MIAMKRFFKYGVAANLLLLVVVLVALVIVSIVHALFTLQLWEFWKDINIPLNTFFGLCLIVWFFGGCFSLVTE